MHRLWSSDARLVRKALRGDSGSFEKLVLRYQRQAHGLAASLRIPPQMRDDVVQEAFFQAFRDLESLREPSRFGLWLVAIVRNVSRKAVRDALRTPHGIGAGPRDAEPVSERLEWKELGESLRGAVDELPEGVREAIFLYYYAGESVRDVARSLGVSSAAAKKRLQRGREILRESLWTTLGSEIRDLLPSARRWEARGRRTTLLLLAALPSGRALAAGARAAPAAAPVPAPGGTAALWTGAALALLAAGILLVLLVRRGGHDAGGRGVRRAARTAVSAPDPRRPDSGAGRTGRPAVGGDPTEARPRRALSGTVSLRETLEPVSGARVAAVRDGTRGHAGLVATDAGGEYAFQDLEPGTYRVWAWKDDLGTDPSTIYEEVSVDPGEHEARLERRLVPGLAVTGRVADRSSGEPIAGARIFWPGGMSLALASTATDGTFRLEGIPDGSWQLCALVEGYAADCQTTTVSSREAPTLTFDLLPGGRVEGRVLFESGEAAAGAAANLWTSSPTTGSRTDHDGRYAIEGIPLGSRNFTVVAWLGGRWAGDANVPEIDPATRRARVDVRLREGRTLTGTVRDPAGEPVAGAEIHVSESAWDPAGTTDEAGRFAIAGVPSAHERLTARKPGFAPGTVEIRNLGAAALARIEVVLAPGASIAGRVVDGSGRPLRDACVMVEWGVRHVGPYPRQLTAPDGTFSLQDLPRAPGRLDVVKPGYCDRREVPLAPDEGSIEIVLEAAGEIRGAVREARSGRPIEAFSVYVEVARSRYPDTSTDEWRRVAFMVPPWREPHRFRSPRGEFTIRGLAPGGFYLLRAASDDTAQSEPVEVAASVAGGETDRVALALEEGRILRGRVVTAGGAPVASAGVLAIFDPYFYVERTWCASPGRYSLSKFAMTDAEGRFALRGLPDAPVQIHVDAPSFARTMVPGIITSDEHQTFILPQEAVLEGEVLDASGCPVEGYEVEVAQGGIRFPAARTDHRGGYRIAGLPPGRADFEARGRGVARRSGTVLLEAGRVTRRDLREPGGAIRVTVLGPASVLARTVVDVARLDAGGDVEDWIEDSTDLHADSDGLFLVAGLAPGTYRVAARRTDEWGNGPLDDPARPTVVVNVGDAETACELRWPSGRISGRVVDARTGAALRGWTIRPFWTGGVAIGPGPRTRTGGAEREGWEAFTPCRVPPDEHAFVLDCLPDGEYVLFAELAGASDGRTRAGWAGPIVLCRSGAAGSSPDATIPVGGTGRVDVLVVDAETGSPVPEDRPAWVEVRPHPGIPLGLSAKAGPSGTVSFSELPAGSYRVEARAMDSAPSGADVMVGDRTVEVRLEVVPAGRSRLLLDRVGPGWDVCQHQIEVRVVSGGDPGWALGRRDADGRVAVGPFVSLPLRERFPIVLPTLPGTYRIRVVVRERDAPAEAEPVLDQEHEVLVPRESEASVPIRLDS